jgi:phage tail protein X
MTIQQGSRYITSPTATLQVNGTAREVIVSSPQENYTFSYTSYQVIGSDRLDTLAQAFYGDSTKWWAISDANPEILDWTNMPVGTIIRVPNAGS